MKFARALAPLVLILGGWGAAAADDSAPAATPAHPEVRAAIRKDFQFVPREPKENGLAPAWATRSFLDDMPPAAGAEPGVVQMRPFVVMGDRTSRALAAALQKQAAQAEVRKSYSRLGIGVHQHRLGPGVVYVVTVFCLPVQVGFAW